MTNLERYQSMSAEEFAEFFHSAMCWKLSTCLTKVGNCKECILNHLNAEYEQEDRT